MRHVEIEDGLRVRFPERSAEFDEGVEVGVAAALMAMSSRAFTHRVASESLAQIRALAPKLGFHVVVESSVEGRSDVSFRRGPERPRLVLAHSRSGRAPTPEIHPGQFGAARRAELRSV